MPKHSGSELVVSGVGVVSAIGQGREAFTAALFEGRHRFGLMRRPGRQRPEYEDGQSVTQSSPVRFLGAEIDELKMPEWISKGALRTASLSARAAVAVVDEAWQDARLDALDPDRIGLVMGGSNIQQRELAQIHETYRGREAFLRPTYGMSFMDSDPCGLCTELFNIRGLAYTAGGASASGQLAVIQALQAVQSGQVDACIAVGALMDLSFWECQGLRSLGAMGSNRFAEEPGSACRPFDRDRDGFIYGENCAAVVVERADSAVRENVEPYARLAGWAMGMDANRNPNPSLEGEKRVIKLAVQEAGLIAADIDYVNTHGTGSEIGDTTELQAFKECGLQHAWLNATKSLTGHGLSAAGAVEMVAVLVQMKAGRLHLSRNLNQPIDPDLCWVRDQAVNHQIDNALNLSLGFGGFNTAVCVRRL